MTLGNLAELTDAELNALVAMKALGWRKVANHQTAWFDDRGWMGDLPGFASDIAAAWLVVEKMRERGCTFSLVTFAESDYHASFFVGPTAFSAIRGSASRSLSEAALYALDEMEEGGMSGDTLTRLESWLAQEGIETGARKVDHIEFDSNWKDAFRVVLTEWKGDDLLDKYIGGGPCRIDGLEVALNDALDKAGAHA